ncbi:MAG: hypothetical protein KJ706_00325, partial [Candidatus Omnitrophica bacterium]|nr:hypothetical protein [Candidatus Omnitrophota bacterium]
CFMLNQCQWSDRPCPIPKEKGLFVDGQGRGVPCHNCRGAKYDADKAFAEAEKTRGCDICPANKVCSKCLFTSPFSEREFCDIRRGADTGKWLTLLEKHNRLNSFARKKNFLARSF